MKKKILLVCISFLGVYCALFVSQKHNYDSFREEHEFSSGDGMEEDIAGRVSWMNKMLADPATGSIPQNIRINEVAFASTLPAENFYRKTFGSYIPRGPWNVGGRTRALAIDINNENILLAGSTMGGFWRSTNGGTSWSKCLNNAPTSNITCIAQNKIPGRTNIWYAGTGELYGSILPGAYFSGNGIYKSVDGGLSWNPLPVTAAPPGNIFTNWATVHNIAVHPTIDSVVFAATFDGVFRSLNGGTTFSKRLGGISGASYWTDVAVTPTGIVYATMSSGGTKAGIWRSSDNGTTWTNISPAFFTSNTQRVVIGVAPSDEKQIYFVAYTPNAGKESFNFEKTPEWNSLWKYTYVSGDGSGTGGTWEDRSANIPTLGGDFGDFISQQGYCLSIRVKPDDANTVFLCGANLYRSTDGFTSTTNTSWIGGYAVNTARPNYQVYANHHPDNHGVIFYPSNPAKMLSVHDGGISLTTNDLASSVSWTSLNNGYINMQFYTVAIDHSSANDAIIGGLQDNGTYYTNNQILTSAWTQPFSSDGAFCFLAPNATEGYMSAQQGRVYRILLDANGNRTQSARLDPKGVDKNRYQFINPFIPDANSYKRIYVPASNHIWRNDDVTAIPLHPQIDSNAVLTNWTDMVNAKLPDSTDAITAIISSKTQNDMIYYGTQYGKIYRLRNASTNTSAPQNITGTNFPQAYINCIVQHPTDTNKLFVVFTNYGVLSIFYSADGGSTWAAVSGNLEQNASGTGNGPSCRWMTIATVNDSLIYFVGTSTGLYATKSINGMQTVWTNQSPDIVGNNIVMMMDYRANDGMFVVATYGAGIFSTKLQSIHDAVNEVSLIKNEITIFPNPVKDILNISSTISSSKYVYSIADIQVKIILQGIFTSSQIDISALKNGNYFLILNDDKNRAVKKFVKE